MLLPSPSASICYLVRKSYAIVWVELPPELTGLTNSSILSIHLVSLMKHLHMSEITLEKTKTQTTENKTLWGAKIVMTNLLLDPKQGFYLLFCTFNTFYSATTACGNKTRKYSYMVKGKKD